MAFCAVCWPRQCLMSPRKRPGGNLRVGWTLSKPPEKTEQRSNADRQRHPPQARPTRSEISKHSLFCRPRPGIRNKWLDQRMLTRERMRLGLIWPMFPKHQSLNPPFGATENSRKLQVAATEGLNPSPKYMEWYGAFGLMARQLQTRTARQGRRSQSRFGTSPRASTNCHATATSRSSLSKNISPHGSRILSQAAGYFWVRNKFSI
jgi:hypothetical protein